MGVVRSSPVCWIVGPCGDHGLHLVGGPCEVRDCWSAFVSWEMSRGADLVQEMEASIVGSVAEKIGAVL